MPRQRLNLGSLVPAAWMGGVLATGLGLSLGVSAMLRQVEQREVADRRVAVAREELEKLHVSLLRSMEVLSSIESLHRVEGTLDRGTFRAFVDAALRRQPELLALSWNPYVPGPRREAMEARVRSEGLPGFAIRELSREGELVPAAGRDAYVPVQWIEPQAANAGVVGYDLASDPARRKAIDEACDTGQPRATGPIHLAQLPGSQVGFLVVWPVYGDPEAPGRDRESAGASDVAGRRAGLAGYAVAVFRVAGLVETAFRNLRAKGLSARLRDGGRDGPVIYEAEPSEALAAREEFDVAGRTWVLEFGPSGESVENDRLSESWLVLLGGLAFTGLSTVYVLGGWRRTRLVAQANALLQEEVQTRQRAEAAAAAANRAKSDFLASMSHEIRTPLNAMLGYGQLLRRDRTLTGDQRDCIEGIHTGGQHLLGLINEILDLSKIEAGRMELQPAEFDLSGLLAGLATTFHPWFAEKRLGFRHAMEPARPGRVFGDEGKLRQVLINLVGNAVKFTPSGEVYVGIRQLEADRWRFEVIDTGAGIPPEEQPEIFKPFHQGRGAGHAGGTGLGLAIAQRQVELMGGRLELQSERGMGSRFHFTLELPRVGPPAEVPDSRTLCLAPGQGIRVLVVDDQRENREVLARLLAAIGCSVVEASDAMETLACVRSARPDLVLLDLLLPGRSGFEVVRELRSDPATAGVRVVILTASALPEHRATAAALGCVEFLGKPVQLEAICELLRRHLGARFQEEDRPEAAGRNGAVPTPAAPVRLPSALHERLLLAAELHSTTALRAALPELRACGPQGEALAERVRDRMRCFDMAGIQRLLQGCAVSGAEVPGSPSSHGVPEPQSRP